MTSNGQNLNLGRWARQVRDLEADVRDMNYFAWIT